MSSDSILRKKVVECPFDLDTVLELNYSTAGLKQCLEFIFDHLGELKGESAQHIVTGQTLHDRSKEVEGKCKELGDKGQEVEVKQEDHEERIDDLDAKIKELDQKQEEMAKN